jgi:hypothetical protein
MATLILPHVIPVKRKTDRSPISGAGQAVIEAPRDSGIGSDGIGRRKGAQAGQGARVHCRIRAVGGLDETPVLEDLPFLRIVGAPAEHGPEVRTISGPAAELSTVTSLCLVTLARVLGYGQILLLAGHGFSGP